MNQTLSEATVGQLVAEQPSRSRVFERWGIDYCCGGKRSLDEACRNKGLSLETVLRDIDSEDAAPRPETRDWTKEPLSVLCDHIVATHHDYLREALPRMSALVAKVSDRHGAGDVRLVQLATVFGRFRLELESHLQKEELILFPGIKAAERGESVAIDGPVSVMLQEHDHAGSDLLAMRHLTDGYEVKPNFCNTYRAMLHGLAELESDLHLHIHKENNILFPRAMAIAGLTS